MITKLLNYIWRGWLIILGTVLTILFFIPVYSLSFKKNHFKYAYFFIRLWCLGMFYGMGFRYKLIKQHNKHIDKNRQYVIIANHTSLIDVLLPSILFPHHPICYVGKKELVKIPIFGTIYKRICVMVDRKSPKSRAEVYKRCAKRMEQGDSIVLFPEGGVPEDTNVLLDKFKDGAFTLSSNHKFPIAVFTIAGLKEMFPFQNDKGHPGTVHVYFNDILEPEESLIEMKNKSFSMIENTLKDFYHH